MVDKVRKILLIFVIVIVGLSGYYLFVKNNAPVEKIILKALDAGIDIEIENFKVVHEVNKGEKWELKADLAQVDQEKDMTLLTNVELTIREKGKQKLWVVADTGSILNGNKDIELVGNVRMIGNTSIAAKRVGKGSIKNREADQ